MKKLVPFLVLAIVGGLAARAHAAPEITLELIPQEDPKKDAPPDIQARVISGTAAPALEKLSLIQTDQKTPIEIKASEVKTYAQGPESLGVVVAYEGWYVWIGNDSYSDDPANKFEGVWKQLTASLDKLNTAGPYDSKAALVWFGKGAQTRWTGALKDLSGDKIGTQKEIGFAGDRPVINWDLIAGVDEAIAQVNKMGTSRKVLIVIGHGTDTNPDTAQAELADRKKKLQADGITAYGIVVGEAAEDGNTLKKLTGNVRTLESTDQLPAAVSAVVDAIVTDRYYVRFPGFDPKLRRSFTWDQMPHTFTLKVDKDEYEIDETALSPKWIPPWKRAKGGFPWLAVIGGVLGAALLVVVGVAVFKKKPAPEPMPVVAPPPVAAPAAPAPAPAGPMKTVMIGIGGDDQGFPVVGWIVPLNGPNQFQTFKLQAGATKIGTGGPVHIVVNDGFMSTEHCQIVMSPAGFVLVDGGSTNGTYVNERKVDKHELVDNDVITMGKTNFRFKSIN